MEKLIFICTGVAQEIKLELRLAIAITDGSTRYRTEVSTESNPYQTKAKRPFD